jgi:hypothetical protein
MAQLHELIFRHSGAVTPLRCFELADQRPGDRFIAYSKQLMVWVSYAVEFDSRALSIESAIRYASAARYVSS